MEFLDRLAAEILAPLAVWVLASGLDDLFLDFAYLRLWFRSRARSDGSASLTAETATAGSRDDAGHIEPAIAILVPCWHEDEVIGDMLKTNLPAIRYTNYDFWIGVYPNDPKTIERVKAVAARSARVRHVVCPHDGPTTKADCLNALYAGVRAHEAATGHRYDILLQHDAEDVIHPDALDAARAGCQSFDMVQIPIFPLATGLHELTHGVYCDEFAEYHLKELPVRARLGGFVPSAGVGTAYRREALERLCEAGDGQPFDTDSLTEDYVTGLELHRLKCTQTLLHTWRPAGGDLNGRRQPIRRGAEELGATRAYFPRKLWPAIRQRTRWLTGNALQSWARFGWNAGPGQRYWLWRDRKALVGAPASALANLLFLYGMARWLSLRGTLDWNFTGWLGGHPLLAAILAANLAILVWRQGVRVCCTLRVYGLAHACATPLRASWGNLINACAVVRAVATYARSRALRQPLAWAKTAHAYPGSNSSMGGHSPSRAAAVRLYELSAARLPTPRVVVRFAIPRWITICRRLTVTLEYRRATR